MIIDAQATQRRSTTTSGPHSASSPIVPSSSTIGLLFISQRVSGNTTFTSNCGLAQDLEGVEERAALP
ncbi:hypothetical protein FIBSPDRAFT_859529 [Athelia psychrophila]|uniref:Uncharacterized protein n=1 Tax=Athelia psychrophila TaxID=1759441 RepID=A0A166L181_9AGAM|nr:hypothetical protein FIBSPDRAFT_859529 [Fibularhizoctonia sp. CBS 109695]